MNRAIAIESKYPITTESQQRNRTTNDQQNPGFTFCTLSYFDAKQSCTEFDEGNYLMPW